jgi:hypothetical protein
LAVFRDLYRFFAKSSEDTGKPLELQAKRCRREQTSLRGADLNTHIPNFQEGEGEAGDAAYQSCHAQLARVR